MGDTIEIAAVDSFEHRAARRRGDGAFIPAEGGTIDETSPAALPNRARKITARILTGILLVVPLVFGGMHPWVYGPAEMILFALGVFLLWASPAPVVSRVAGGSTFRPALAAGAAFFIYASARTIAAAIEASSDPTLGVVDRWAAIAPSLRGLREILFFLAAAVIVRLLVVEHRASAERLTKTLVAAGVGAAAIGLAHWFYDNGRLFWVFEPNNVFVSTRARWPFVNPNHLACFLAPTLFLLIARSLTLSGELRTLAISQRTGKIKGITDLAADPRIQRKISSLGVHLTVCLAVMLSIIATLSRGVWLGTTVGLVVFLVLNRFSRPVEPPSAPHHTAPLEGSERGASGRRRRSRSRRGEGKAAFAPSPRTWRLIRWGVAAFFCLAVYTILRERGAELVESRIEYGLLHSKEDMRLQLMRDTAPLISAHPAFGVGLGRWAGEHQAVMSPLLSGVNPVYLHNEPIQLVAELGFIGLLPVLAAVWVLSSSGVRALRDSRDRLLLVGLLSSLAATAFATLFDFHLRVPAIVLQLACICALIIDFVESAPRSGGAEPSTSSLP